MYAQPAVLKRETRLSRLLLRQFRYGVGQVEDVEQAFIDINLPMAIDVVGIVQILLGMRPLVSVISTQTDVWEDLGDR